MIITYCLGDILAKRSAFTLEGEKEDALYLDNCEVVGAPKGERGTVFGIGENPYGNMTVEEFIRYESGKKASEVVRLCKIFGVKLSLNKKIKRLNPLSLRAVFLVSGFTPKTETLYINLDSLLPTPKNKKLVSKLLNPLSRYFKIFVAVSDSRFIPRTGKIRRYDESGKYCEIALGKYIIERAKKKDFYSLAGENCDSLLKKATLARY